MPISPTSAHANLVVISGVGVLIMGPSKSGKSQLSYDLIQQGYSLVADDLVLLSLDSTDSTQQKLIGRCPESGFGKLKIHGQPIVDLTPEKHCVREHTIDFLVYWGDRPQSFLFKNLKIINPFASPYSNQTSQELLKLIQTPNIFLTSFGFKFGDPNFGLNKNLDLILDIRDAPNPYWNTKLRPYSGEDKIIQEFFLNSQDMMEKINLLENQIENFIKNKLSEKSCLISIWIGCTGGKHRSVFAVVELAKRLGSKYPCVRFEHRDRYQW